MASEIIHYSKATLSILLLSLVLLTPQVYLGSDVTIIGKKLNLDYLIALIGCLVFGWRYLFREDSEDVRRTVLFTVLGVSFLGVGALFFTSDISYLKNFLFLLKNMFRLYLFYILAVKLFKGKDPWTIIAFSLIPFVLVTILFQFDPGLSKSYFEITIYPSEFIADSLRYQRTSWLGHATWEYTVLFSFFFCLKVATSKITYQNLLISSLLLLGCTLYGRNWMVIFPIFLLIHIFDFESLKRISVFFVIDFLAVIAATFLLYELILEGSTYFRWAWEFFYRFFKFNEFSSVSTKTLGVQHKAFVEEYVFSWKSFLLGDGKYNVISNGKAEYYMKKDSGYIRELLCVGAFYSGILYTSVCFYFFKSNFMQKFKRVSLFLLVSIFILQIKGDILFFSFGLYFLIELFSYECNSEKKHFL